MVAAKAPAPPSARSSRATQVITAWARPIRCHRLGHPVRLAGVEGQGMAGVDLAEPAGPGAAGPVDHEGRRPVRPALVDVGTARLLAHRHQIEVAEVVLESEVPVAHGRLRPAATRACGPAAPGRRPGRRPTGPSAARGRWRGVRPGSPATRAGPHPARRTGPAGPAPSVTRWTSSAGPHTAARRRRSRRRRPRPWSRRSPRPPATSSGVGDAARHDVVEHGEVGGRR